MNKIESVVQELDDCLRKWPWMDFEVIKYTGYDLVIHGCIDPSSSSDVSITFHNVFCVSMPFELNTCTSIVVFGILSGSPAKEFNLRYQVEEGFTIFFFKPEKYPEDFLCLIAAKNVSWELLSDFHLQPR